MNAKLFILFFSLSYYLYSQKNLTFQKEIQNSSLLVKKSNYSQNDETIILMETFGSGGNTTTAGIAPAYCWNNQPYPPNQFCGNSPIPGFPDTPCKTNGRNSWFLDDDQYVVTSALNPNNCSWFDYRDHTSGGTEASGRFLAVNIGGKAGSYGVLYSKVINSVIPNQPINVEVYVANLIIAGNTGATDPSLIFELVNPAGIVVASLNSGVVDNITNDWQKYSFPLNYSGLDTTLTFNIRSGSILYAGNDVAIDDIKLSQSVVLNTTESVFEKVAIYPNPVKEQLHIDNVAITKVLVYDVLGHQVKEGNYNESLNNILNLKDVINGVYFLNIQTEKASIIKRIIVQQ